MLHILTIVLDGMPWIRAHLPEFERLENYGVSWRWHIVHGASMNTGSTKWCCPQPPRLSIDGTSEYLNSIRTHPHVRIYESHRWASKDHMVNAPLGSIPNCILMQVDSDELWTAENLKNVVELFSTYSAAQGARFFCDYYVGPSLVTVGEDCYGNQKDEWLRAWRFKAGMRFNSHEPPVLAGNLGAAIDKSTTKRMGITFRHMAYATERQAAFKERFYGYKGAASQWRNLQAYRGPFPAKLKPFLPWVDNRVLVTRAP